MNKIICLLFLFMSNLAMAQKLNITFEELCALPNDKVLDTVDFVLSADSEYISGVNSKTISLHPGKCFRKPEVLKRYAFSLNVFPTGKPLRIQIAHKGLIFNVLGEEKIFIGEEDQLKRVRDVPKSTFLLNQDLYKGDQVIDLSTKYATARVHLQLIPPAGLQNNLK